MMILNETPFSKALSIHSEKPVRSLSFNALLPFLVSFSQFIKHASFSEKPLVITSASNFVCALVQRSAELLGGCGFSKTDALHALAPLMRSNLAHVIEHGAVSALTGPIERGDTQTVQKHLSCLTERDDRQLYALLGLEQVKMAQEKHPEQDYGTLAALLNREKEQNE